MCEGSEAINKLCYEVSMPLLLLTQLRLVSNEVENVTHVVNCGSLPLSWIHSYVYLLWGNNVL